MVLSQDIYIYVLLGLTAILAALVVRLELKLRRFTQGKSGASLEEVVTGLADRFNETGNFRRDMENYLITVEKRLRQSVGGIGTVRFNAFKGTGDGGNQSFAITCLTHEGNGVVISSICARERTSMFAKPVKNFTSEFELTPEENQSLEHAKQSLTSQLNP